MRPTKRFTPRICDGVNYEGYVELFMPKFDERQDFLLMDEMSDVVENAIRKRNGEEVKEEEMGTRKTMSILKKISSQMDKWVSEINIKRLDDGFVFNSLEAVEYDTEVGSTVQEMCTELLGKYRYGNPNVPQS
jgi:hypothetical protein